MPKRKTNEEKLADLIRDIGFIQAESVFRAIKTYAIKPEPKQRKKDKPVAVESKAS